MNLGFYIENTGGSEQNVKIFNALNEAIDKQELDDASVFFNNASYNPIHTKFGLFNGTDIWHFTGSLIATSILNVKKALKTVNNFSISYLYNPSDKDVFGLLEMVGKVNVIATNESEAKEFYRLTGHQPKMLNDFSVESIKRVLQ